MSDPIDSLIAGEHDRQERAWTADGLARRLNEPKSWPR